MKNGDVWCWLVFRPDAKPGARWTTFRTRTGARLYQAAFGGELFRTVRTH